MESSSDLGKLSLCYFDMTTDQVPKPETSLWRFMDLREICLDA